MTHCEDCHPRVEVEAPLQLTGPELLALRFLASTVPWKILEGWFAGCDCMTYWPLLVHDNETNIEKIKNNKQI